MNKYPNIPGHNSVHTSIDASESMVNKALAIRQRIYSLMKDGDELTSEEASVRLGLSHDNCWKRFSELRAKGLVEDSGQTRKNKSGKDAIVWRLRTGEGTDIDRYETREELQATIDRLKKENENLQDAVNRLLSPPFKPQQMRLI